jgi:hypothetical protein
MSFPCVCLLFTVFYFLLFFFPSFSCVFWLPFPKFEWVFAAGTEFASLGFSANTEPDGVKHHFVDT